MRRHTGLAIALLLAAVALHAENAVDYAAAAKQLRQHIAEEKQKLTTRATEIEAERQALQKQWSDKRAAVQEINIGIVATRKALPELQRSLGNVRQAAADWRLQRAQTVEMLRYNAGELAKLYPLTGLEGGERLATIAAADPRGSLVDALSELSDFYDRYIEFSTTVHTSAIPVYNAAGGAQTLDTVRLGVLGGVAVGDEAHGVLKMNLAGGPPDLVENLPGKYGDLLPVPENAAIVPIILDVSDGVAIESLKHRKTFRQYFEAGGVVMYPLAAIAILALLMVIERSVVYGRVVSGHDRTRPEIARTLKDNDIAGAATAAEKAPGTMARLWQRGIELIQRRGGDVEEEMQEAIIAELPGLEKHLSSLAVFAAIAPLLGLLGTVGGMIKTFEIITQYGTGNARLLADGISEALVTTQVGLAIAIPVLVAHAALSRQAKKIVAQMEQLALIVMTARARDL